MRRTLKALLLSSIIFASGCASPIILHPISPEHIFPVAEGTKVGDTVTKHNGFFISEFYVREVMGAKIKEVEK